MNSDSFIFDQEIIAQAVLAGFRMTEIPVPVRYFPEASSANLWQSVVYGLQILLLLCKFQLHTWGIMHSQQFESLRARYSEVPNRMSGDCSVNDHRGAPL
jgi:hypothetical protein